MYDGHILIVGLGSVGRRHLANLQALGHTNIRFCRTGLSTLPAGGLDAYPTDDSLEQALKHRPRAVIVSNPSALHLQVAHAAALEGAHLLIEKPLSHSLDQVQHLQDVVASRGLHVLMGFQFRFHPAFARIKAWVDDRAIGDIVSAHAHWGEWLPGMHPWEDFRKGYAARDDLGGGVLLTLCHPFDYLRWFLGDVDGVDATEVRQDDLDLPVETSVDVRLRFTRGAVGHVHLDFLQRPHEHRLEITGTEGSISWSQSDHIARLHRTANAECQVAPPPAGFERNTMFLDEMRHFLQCLQGQASPCCTLGDGVEALKIVMAARQALSEARA